MSEAPTGNGWPTPEGVDVWAPAPRRRRRGLSGWQTAGAIVAGVVASSVVLVVLFWPYLVGAAVVGLAWKVISR